MRNSQVLDHPEPVFMLRWRIVEGGLKPVVCEGESR